MQKDNRIVLVAILVLLLTMVGLILVSGTYAKYVSSVTASDTATVAKWAFTVSGKDIHSKDITFDIFSTLDDANNVSTGDGSIIAPGTSGSFKVDLTNSSQVNAEYKVVYKISNDQNIPLEFSTDKQTWNSSIAVLNHDFSPIEMNQTLSTDTIYWRWAFTGDDTTDSKLGEEATKDTAPKVTVTAEIDVQQVD